jgi:hypothetical protein
VEVATRLANDGAHALLKQCCIMIANVGCVCAFKSKHKTNVTRALATNLYRRRLHVVVEHAATRRLHEAWPRCGDVADAVDGCEVA